MTRLVAVAAGGLALANCSGTTAKLDPRYGVSASPRVVDLGDRAPKGGGTYRVGKPYVVAGRTYYPEEDSNYNAVGLASWYGDDFHGRYTSNGEVFDENSITAAHPTLPLPSYVRVTNLHNHRSIVVRVNDRGPFVRNRIIDLSVKTAKLLGFYDNGVAKVKVEYVGRAPIAGSDDEKLIATLRDNGSSERSVVAAAAAEKKMLLASASSRPLSSTYSDNRRLNDVPAPPDRPYRLGPGARTVAAAEPPTTELAAAARPQPVENEAPEPQQQASPVSAYAPVGYDGHSAGLLSGRGLY